MRFRTVRDKLFDSMLRTRLGRKAAFRAVANENCIALKALGDHMILSSPIDNIGREILQHGHFERDKFNAIVSFLRERQHIGGTFLEIGANIGSQTIYAALSGAFGRQIAIEPAPQNLIILRANIALNALGDRVGIVPCAVGASSGTSSMRTVFGNCGAATLRDLHDERYGEPIQVEVKTVDDILNEHNIDAGTISLVWMDIEGLEPQAWKGMSKIIKARAPICMEFSPIFYGKAQTAAFAREIFDAYNEIFLIHTNRISEATPRMLLDIESQADILMI